MILAVTTAAAPTQAAAATGEEPVHRLEPLVVTASREPQPSDRAPGSVTVITREEIERARYTSVVDILRHVPGVHVDQPGSRGSRASIYMRGLDPNHTLILIDGVRMNDPLNNRGGSFDLSTLDPAGIERIEIVRGSISAVHGSDAIAGVVNIITRTGTDEPELSLNASGGRFGVYRLSGDAGGRIGALDLSLAGAWVDEGAPPDRQEFRGGNFKTAFGLRLPNQATLRGTLRFADSENLAYPDDSGGDELAVIRQLEERDTRELDMSLTAAQAAGRWLDSELTFGYHHRREKRDSPGIAPGIRNPFGIPAESSRDVLDSIELSLRNSIHPVESLSLTLGGEVTWEQGDSNGELSFPEPALPRPTDFALERAVGGPFAEAQWACDCGLSVYGGVRADFPDSASPVWSPRFFARYDVPGVGMTLSGSWGEGFKLPSFYSLAGPIGNPNLVSERSRGWDVGTGRDFWDGRVTAQFTWFDLEVKNLIDFAPNPPRLVNRSKVASHGFEFELQARPFDSLDLRGHLTYTETDILDSTAELLNRPRWRGGAELLWAPIPSVTLRAALLVVGSVRSSSVPTGERRLNSWSRVDLSAFWSPLEQLTLYLEIDNLLDANYEEAIGFSAPGIRPRLGITWRR